MSMYRHVIWDWNGTLLDDAWLCLEVINELLGRAGLPRVDADRYAAVFGFPLDEYCRQLGFASGREAYERLSDDFSVIYEARRRECSLRRGARQVLAQLGELGVSQSLLSAYSHPRLVELVEAYGLSAHFRIVAGADNEYGEGKVEMGRRQLRELGCAPEDVLFVGDTLHDWEVAQAVGASCVLVDSGHQHAHRLRRAGTLVLADLAGVVPVVMQGPAAALPAAAPPAGATLVGATLVGATPAAGTPTGALRAASPGPTAVAWDRRARVAATRDQALPTSRSEPCERP